MGASAGVRPFALHLPAHLAARRARRCSSRSRAPATCAGCQDTRTPLVIALAANVFNLALEVAARLRLPPRDRGFGVGHGHRPVRGGHRVPRRSSAATCGASHASARPNRDYVKDAAIVGATSPSAPRRCSRCSPSTTAIASRIGDAEVAAHQIALQLWFFLALALDAIAIAGQAIVGRDLGASDAAATRRSSRRMLEWGVVAGVVACAFVILCLPVLTRRVHRRRRGPGPAAAGALWPSR